MAALLGFKLRSAYPAASAAGRGDGLRRWAIIQELVTLLVDLLPVFVVTVLISGIRFESNGVASRLQCFWLGWACRLTARSSVAVPL